MFAYEADYEILDKVAMSRPPRFSFVQPSREVIDRLIVRASMEKDLYWRETSVWFDTINRFIKNKPNWDEDLTLYSPNTLWLFSSDIYR